MKKQLVCLRKSCAAIVTSICVSFAIKALCATPQDLSPPAAGDIHERCEKLWDAKKYDELDAYIDELVAKWPNYVPVKIAVAMRYDGFGARLEESARVLKETNDAIGVDEFGLFQPFIELLDARIRMTEMGAKAYARQMTTEQRLRECDPRTNPKFGASSRFEFVDLFVLAPEVFIEDGKIVPAVVSRKSEEVVAKKFIDKDDEWIEVCVASRRVDTTLRRACARVSANRILEADGVEGLVKEFNGVPVYNMPWLSKVLLERKTETLKAIRKCVASGDLDRASQILCICFLVAIESPKDEVISALEAIHDTAEYDSVKALAEKAIDRIKNKKDGDDPKQ